MDARYGRDLDLNLLRVFVVVAEARSVTRAASQLYLTQPAVSSALRRLTSAVGARLFVRAGRGIELTSRGEQLLAVARPHLAALVEAALAPAGFDPRTSDRLVRLGLADAIEPWLLGPLIRALGGVAPRMRIVSSAVQFRTVLEALSSRRIDIAVTVADEMPASVARARLFWGTFVCLFDPRHARVPRRLTEAVYFAHEHVVVSYNGDLRGIVEDALEKARDVRCALSSFAHVGEIVDGGPLLATVPRIIAEHVRATRPHLRAAPLPFSLVGAPIEMLWLRAAEDDPAVAFVREALRRVVGPLAQRAEGATSSRARRHPS